MVNTDKIDRLVNAYSCGNTVECINCDCAECKADFRRDLEEVINEQLELDRLEY